MPINPSLSKSEKNQYVVHALQSRNIQGSTAHGDEVPDGIICAAAIADKGIPG